MEGGGRFGVCVCGVWFGLGFLFAWFCSIIYRYISPVLFSLVGGPFLIYLLCCDHSVLSSLQHHGRCSARCFLMSFAPLPAVTALLSL